MAVDFKVPHSRNSVYKCPPEHITVLSNLNGRHELPDIEWLIKSIVQYGQLQPGVVRNDGGKPVLSAGFSRWRAVCEINKRKLTPEPLQFLFSVIKGNEKDGFIVGVQENKRRNDTTPLDDGYNILQMERWGMTLDSIGEIYGEDVQWVKKRLELTNLCPEAQEAVRSGAIKPNAVKHFTKMAAEQQRKAVKSGAALTDKRSIEAAAGIHASSNGHRKSTSTKRSNKASPALPTSDMETVLEDIRNKRRKQDEEHGGPSHDDTHGKQDWCDFLSKFTKRAMDRGEFNDAVFEEHMLNVAALAVAAIQSTRRKRGK